ncbi:hypothetical protein J6590_056536 [Homalodisca vitripennis]|nr:hypothetical protein J6590_056536 [Homalodisca vitripennis]
MDYIYSTNSRFPVAVIRVATRRAPPPRVYYSPRRLFSHNPGSTLRLHQFREQVAPAIADNSIMETDLAVASILEVQTGNDNTILEHETFPHLEETSNDRKRKISGTGASTPVTNIGLGLHDINKKPKITRYYKAQSNGPIEVVIQNRDKKKINLFMVGKIIKHHCEDVDHITRVGRNLKVICKTYYAANSLVDSQYLKSYLVFIPANKVESIGVVYVEPEVTEEELLQDGTCGLEYHSGDCGKPPKCINCNGDHPSNNKGCPEFKRKMYCRKNESIQGYIEASKYHLPNHTVDSRVGNRFNNSLLKKASYAKVTKIDVNDVNNFPALTYRHNRYAHGNNRYLPLFDQEFEVDNNIGNSISKTESNFNSSHRVYNSRKPSYRAGNKTKSHQNLINLDSESNQSSPSVEGKITVPEQSSVVDREQKILLRSKINDLLSRIQEERNLNKKRVEDIIRECLKNTLESGKQTTGITPGSNRSSKSTTIRPTQFTSKSNSSKQK